MATESQEASRDARAVFVIYGRHEKTRDAMFACLNTIGLRPLEWSHLVRLTGKGSPYVGEVLDAGFKRATAAVVLLTPDDEAQLRPKFRSTDEPTYELTLTGQARPNVIFEAGMALGIAPDRTILVEFGMLRPFSDISGRHAIRMNNTERRRRDLAECLETAGCTIDLSGAGWKSAGDFDAAIRDLTRDAGDETSTPSELDSGYSIEFHIDRSQRGCNKYEINYPQIQGLADPNIQRRLNTLFEKEFKRLGGLTNDQGQPQHINDELTSDPQASSSTAFEIGLTTSSLISLRAYREDDFGGMYPVTVSTGFVVDALTGYRYNIHDLFRSDQNYLSILKDHIQKSLSHDINGDPDWRGEIPVPEKETPDMYDFYFSERELVIINLFSIHVLEAAWARIPFSELEGIADSKGPLYKILESRKKAFQT